MTDRFEISELMDFYGSLLTEKQLSIMDLYFNDDLSLAEIAEINKTSRQATHDSIKRCIVQLQNYELKLNLKEKYFKRVEAKEKLMSQMKKDSNLDNTMLELINDKIEEIINL